MNPIPKIILCDLTYTQQTISSDIMPAAIGNIAVFLQQELSLPVDISLYKYPEPLIEDLETMDSEEAVNIVGFANYCWNCHLSLEFAKVIKKRFPQTVIVFGGPNLSVDPTEQEAFLRSHPVIDFHIVKEGEVGFFRLVKALIENDYDCRKIKSHLPNLIFIDEHGTFQTSQMIDRVAVESIPSPYVTGLMDSFFDGRLLPVVQTNRGCPFTCTFCTEGMRYWKKVYKSRQEKIVEELIYIARKMSELTGETREDLLIADSNFGMFKEDKATAHTLVQTRSQYNYPKYINVATGKNNKEQVLEIARTLNGALKLAGSVQSLNKEVLKNIKRSNINEQEIMSLAMKSNEIGANSYSEIILALPGDTLKAHFESIQTIVEAGFNTIAMYQLMILPGTEMGAQASREEYGMVSKFRLLPRCYGYFDVLGEAINAVEIEEICIANNTLSYQDYLKCRKMNFIVNVFYNDGIFSDLLKFLRWQGLSCWEWLLTIYEETIPHGNFTQLLNDFMEETAGELWDSREELMAYCQNRDNLQKFINGEIGGNLMFKYKGLSLTQYLEDVARIARESIHALLRQHQKDSDENLTFTAEIVQFNLLKKIDIFVETPINLEAIFTYDIGNFSEDSQLRQIQDYHFMEPAKVLFEFTEVQLQTIQRYLTLFGNDWMGVSRILSRVYIRKLFRNAKTEAGVTVAQEDSTFITGQASLTGLNEFQ